MSEVSLYKAGHRTYRTHSSSLELLVRVTLFSTHSGPCGGARSNGFGVTEARFGFSFSLSIYSRCCIRICSAMVGFPHRLLLP